VRPTGFLLQGGEAETSLHSSPLRGLAHGKWDGIPAAPCRQVVHELLSHYDNGPVQFLPLCATRSPASPLGAAPFREHTEKRYSITGFGSLVRSVNASARCHPLCVGRHGSQTLLASVTSPYRARASPFAPRVHNKIVIALMERSEGSEKVENFS